MSKQLRKALMYLGIVFIPFFIYKQFRLKDYYEYPGKIIAIDTIDITVPRFKGVSEKEIRHIPVVEYYTNKDTIIYRNYELNYFSHYDIGDRMKILERKDIYKIKIYSFWYYFLSIPELIILLFIALILYKFDKFFKNIKS